MEIYRKECVEQYELRKNLIELVFLYRWVASNEIGMNLNLYGFGPRQGREKWIMVDFGVTFGDAKTRQA